MVRWVLKKWPIMIEDDRVREVALVRPPKVDRSDYRSRWWPRYVGKHAGHGVKFEELFSASHWYGFLVGGSFFATSWAARYLLQGINFAGKDWVVALLAGLIICPLFPVLLRERRREAKERLRVGYLRACQCPCCDYDLTGQVADADGCRVCPECGAAWKVAKPVESTN